MHDREIQPAGSTAAVPPAAGLLVPPPPSSPSSYSAAVAGHVATAAAGPRCHAKSPDSSAGGSVCFTGGSTAVRRQAGAAIGEAAGGALGIAVAAAVAATSSLLQRPLACRGACRSCQYDCLGLWDGLPWTGDRPMAYRKVWYFLTVQSPALLNCLMDNQTCSWVTDLTAARAAASAR